jgi:hypothetical protein
MSQFYLSIQRHDGSPVRVRPGGTAERELTHAIIDGIVARLRPSEEALTRFQALKRVFRPKQPTIIAWRTDAYLRTAVESSVRDVLLRAKSDVVPDVH